MCPGVGLVVNLSEVLKIKVGVDLSGRNVSVAQEFLDSTKITARFQQMAGKRVTQHVGMHTVPETLPLGPNLHPLLNRSHAKPPPTTSNEKRPLILSSNSTPVVAPRLQGIVRVPPDWQQSFFTSFASHRGYALFKIYPP